MSAATALTEANFKDEVSSGVTLVDFWAEWCGPCKAIAPVIDEVAQDYEGKAKVAKVDVDSEGGLAAEYGVQSIPTLLIIKDGAEVARLIGAKPKDELAKALDAAIG